MICYTHRNNANKHKESEDKVMDKVTIYIDNTGEAVSWIYFGDSWKEYVAEDFDEKVVMFGNDRERTIENADWWITTKSLIEDLEYHDGDIEDLDGCYSEEQLKKAKELYDNCTYSDDIDFIIKMVKVLYPDMELERTEIRGYCQGDWQDVVYVKDSVDINTLQAYYFGMLTDIRVVVNENEDDFGDVITDDELWEMERGDLKEELRKRYELDKDADIKIMKCDGYVQTKNWKEV